MITPNDEKSYFYRYAIVSDKKFKPVVEYFKKLLEKNTFKIKEFEEKENNIMILSQVDEEKLGREAQYCKIRKVFTNNNNKIGRAHV